MSEEAMTTPLPSRLRESARLLRGLYLYSENQPVKLIDKADSTRIAAELTEAADALEAGPWMPIETAPKDKALLTHDGVSYNLAHFNTALWKWIANHPYDERLPREPIRWTLLPPHPRSGTAARVAQEGGGVSASAYLAKVEADPRRAAALQRARDRTAGVLADAPAEQWPRDLSEAEMDELATALNEHDAGSIGFHGLVDRVLAVVRRTAGVATDQPNQEGGRG